MLVNTEFLSIVNVEDEYVVDIIEASAHNAYVMFHRQFGDLTDINRAIKAYRLHIVSILAKAINESGICSYQEAIHHIVETVLKEEKKEDDVKRAIMINDQRFGRTVLFNYIRDYLAIPMPNTKSTFHKELGKRMQVVKTPLKMYVTDATTARIVFPTAMIRSIKKIGYPEDPKEII